MIDDFMLGVIIPPEKIDSEVLAERVAYARQVIIDEGHDPAWAAEIPLVIDDLGIPTTECLIRYFDPKTALLIREHLRRKYGYIFPSDQKNMLVINDEPLGFDLYDDHIDLSEMNRWLKAYMEKVHESAPKESTYVIEEAAELVTELMVLVKGLTKSERKVEENKGLIFEEACDVLATILMMFVRDGYHLNDVLPYITSKYKRAVERFDENKSV